MNDIPEETLNYVAKNIVAAYILVSIGQAYLMDANDELVKFGLFIKQLKKYGNAINHNYKEYLQFFEKFANSKDFQMHMLEDFSNHYPVIKQSIDKYFNIKGEWEEKND